MKSFGPFRKKWSGSVGGEGIAARRPFPHHRHDVEKRLTRGGGQFQLEENLDHMVTIHEENNKTQQHLRSRCSAKIVKGWLQGWAEVDRHAAKGRIISHCRNQRRPLVQGVSATRTLVKGHAMRSKADPAIGKNGQTRRSQMLKRDMYRDPSRKGRNRKREPQFRRAFHLEQGWRRRQGLPG